MNRTENMKLVVEWIFSLVLRLRLRKTYWSIATPLTLMIAGYFVNKAGFLVKVTSELYENTDIPMPKIIWDIIHYYVSIHLPWWCVVPPVIMLILITYVRWQEIKAKKQGFGISPENIRNSISDMLFKEIEEIKSELTFQPDEKWFFKQCETSILDLGKRYTPELNIELEVLEIFEGLGRTEEFKRKTTKVLDQLLIRGKKVLKSQLIVKKCIESLENDLDELQVLFHKTEFRRNCLLPIDEFENLLNQLQNSIQIIDDYYTKGGRRLQKEKKITKINRHGYELGNIREFKYEVSIFQNLIHSSSFRVANNPFLLLDGKAGIGKSHLIGDVISRRINEEHESIFLLGQHFVTEEDPWTQIFKKLQINSKSEDFLEKLNIRAEGSGKRIVIFIDAINEGKGIFFWNNSIKSFISEIQRYKWLGLVLTIRTSYKNLIFPKEERDSLDIIDYHHYGFRNIEYEASKLFFDNYKIELPNVPLLHPEFQNPLFLKLFCEGINKAGLTRIPEGIQGITSIIDFFVKNVNNVLSKPKKYGYSDSLNLVQKSIYALIDYKVTNQLRYVPYESAYKIIDKSISGFIDKKGFIDELIVEGVLSKSLFRKDNDDNEEGVYLAYERFEDHLTAQYLLERYSDLEKEFKEGGKLFNYVKNENAIYIHKGLIEAFSIQVPEKNGCEFYALIPDHKDKSSIVESFIESLLWRKVDTINEKLIVYINEHVFSCQGMHDFFWETILAVTGIPNHFFNACFLHNHLIKYSLPERDATWTQFLKYKYYDVSSVKRLIDWAWNQSDKSHISDETIFLYSITLAWFHTSTNRKIRDCSTKALVSLLKNRLDVLVKLLKIFEEVNDPYVYERLFAVAYGCTLRTNQKKKIIELSEYIFKTIFSDPSGVIPHILLRDYARGVIEYANYLGIELSFDLTKVRPPYESIWPKEIPSREELKSKYDNDNYRDIYDSVMGFGDFARYVVGTNNFTSDWSGCRIGETPVDREKNFEEFKNKLSLKQLELLNNLDPIITKEPDADFKNEYGFEIKIAVNRKTEEELKQIRNDFVKSLPPDLSSQFEQEVKPFLDHNFRIVNTGECFDLRIAQRLIFSKVIELGWNPELHLSFDKDNRSQDRGASSNERIGKKYQWIAYHEYMALLSDNFIKKDRWENKKENPYQGPWDLYVRDIDPTMLISKTGSHDDTLQEGFWWYNNKIFDWKCTNENWVNNSDILPIMDNIIQIKDDEGHEWLVLGGYPSWLEPKKIGEEKWEQPRKQFWCHIKSYLVKNDEFLSFKDWATVQEFMERWIPESGYKHGMFSREYYWSPANDYFMNEYYDGTEWTKVRDRESGKYVAEVSVTTQDFLWEEDFDKSKEKTISFLKPSTVIFKGVNLKFDQREGEFIDSSKVVQCFASNVYHNSISCLLVRKHSFLKFINENNLKVVWTVLGGKEIIGGQSFGTDYQGRQKINGFYYFDSGEFNGEIKVKTT